MRGSAYKCARLDMPTKFFSVSRRPSWPSLISWPSWTSLTSSTSPTRPLSSDSSPHRTLLKSLLFLLTFWPSRPSWPFGISWPFQISWTSWPSWTSPIRTLSSDSSPHTTESWFGRAPVPIDSSPHMIVSWFGRNPVPIGGVVTKLLQTSFPGLPLSSPDSSFFSHQTLLYSLSASTRSAFSTKSSSSSSGLLPSSGWFVATGWICHLHPRWH